MEVPLVIRSDADKACQGHMEVSEAMTDKTQSPTDLIEAALAGVVHMQGLSSEQVGEYLRSQEPGPFEIPLDGGGTIWTTLDGISAIEQLAKHWRSTSYKAKIHLDEKAAKNRTCRTLGSMLVELRSGALDTQALDAASLVKGMFARLEERLDDSLTKVQFYFPCRVLNDVHFDSIEVGPVQFHSLSSWLDQAEEFGLPGQLHWIGPLREFLVTPFASIEEQSSALQMLPDEVVRRYDALSGCNRVASVALVAADPARAADRASTAVRLAVDVMGLVMNRRAAAGLRGPGDQLRSTSSYVFSQVQGRDIMESWSLDVPDSGGTREMSKQYVMDTGNLRLWAGKAISAVIHPDHAPGAKEPSIAQRLCDAIFWFGEARRDQTAFMALVRYGMALDVLAKGFRKKGIITLVERLTGTKRTESVIRDTSLETLIGQIYDEGRSQFGHGGRAALIQDLPASIEAADSLTAHVIRLYAASFAHYTGEQKYESFLEAIPDCLKEAASAAQLTEGVKNG